jgi:hypothetical protein
MKKNTPYLIAPAIMLIFILLSCNKHNSPSPAGISGPIIQKWNTVRHIDTTVLFNGPSSHFDYKGTSGDYLDFRADGNLYRSENGARDTSAFTLSHDTLTVNHKYAPYITTFKVEVLTKDSLQLNGMSYVIINYHDYEITHYYLHK